MKVTCVTSFDKRKQSDALVIPFWIVKGKVVCAGSLDKSFVFPQDPITTGDFLGKAEEITFIYSSSSKEARLVFLGLGAKEDVNAETMRRAYAAIVRLARRKKWGDLSCLIPAHSDDYILASVEGALLANYAYDKMKKKSLSQEPTFLVQGMQWIGIAPKLSKDIEQKSLAAKAVYFTRDLVNANADDMTPAQLCLLAKELSSDKLNVTILRKKELEKEHMGLLLAVGQGARHEPALIVMEYKGQKSSKDVTALVGKGITFDTGGLNLKISGSMETMKCDMAGAAAVMGVMKALVELNLSCNVIGVIATAENAIGPMSYKPGDVIVGRSGRSVEVNDTDAEGRLVLADALSYVQDCHKPSRIIDIATLTGGIVVALGEEASGLFSTSDVLAEQLMRSAEVTSERLWRMPLYPEYKEALKSSIADMKNSGGRKASSSKGAVFLQQFVDKSVPWAHLDIAGTAFLSETKIYHPTQATGVGVRLLLSFLGGV